MLQAYGIIEILAFKIFIVSSTIKKIIIIIILRLLVTIQSDLEIQILFIVNFVMKFATLKSPTIASIASFLLLSLYLYSHTAKYIGT